MTNTDKAEIWAALWQQHAPPDLAALPTRHALQGGELLFAKDYNGRRWRFDWALPSPSVMVAVEIDGGKQMVRWSEKKRRYVVIGSHNSEDDMERQNVAVVLGWRVLRFTPDMLRRDPLGCVQIVAEVVRREMNKFAG